MAIIKLPLSELKSLLREEFQLTPEELQSAKDWTWHSSTQQGMSPEQQSLLKSLGEKQKLQKRFRLPKVLYRAVRSGKELPTDEQIIGYAQGFKSWSKSKAGALHYVKTNTLSGVAVNSILFQWHEPSIDEVLIDFDSLNSLTGTELGADAGEYAALPKNIQVAEIQKERISGRRGDATRLVVDVR